MGLTEYKDKFLFFYITANHKRCHPMQWLGQLLQQPEEYFPGQVQSKEKSTVTALARRGETPPPCTAPAGWRTALYLSDVFLADPGEARGCLQTAS